ncbi:MAG: S8 family serine peptidase [Nanoarchaeota archaeon]|nr:S8 family serine peptidase [Nanoarchaeota archaeon]
MKNTSLSWNLEEFSKPRAPISIEALSKNLRRAKRNILYNLIESQIYEAKTEYNVQGRGIKIAVFDTGVDPEHEELEGRCKKGFNPIEDNENTSDHDGHGTMVAGLIAGRNFIASEAEIYPVKIIAPEDKQSDKIKLIRRSLEWCIKNNINIINISARISQYRPDLKSYISRTIRRKGIIIVAAAGNSSSGALFPASFEDVISIGGIGTDKGQYRFYVCSNMWPTVNLCAPAEEVFGPCSDPKYPDEKYCIDTGTSYATPHVTGVIALGLELLKKYSTHFPPQEIRRLLEKSTKPLDDEDIYEIARGYDPKGEIFKNKKFINKCAFGTGMLQAKDFLELLIKRKKINIE